MIGAHARVRKLLARAVRGANSKLAGGMVFAIPSPFPLLALFAPALQIFSDLLA